MGRAALRPHDGRHARAGRAAASTKLAPDTRGARLEWEIGAAAGASTPTRRSCSWRCATCCRNAVKFTRAARPADDRDRAPTARATTERVVLRRRQRRRLRHGVRRTSCSACSSACTAPEEFEGTGIGLANVRASSSATAAASGPTARRAQGATFGFAHSASNAATHCNELLRDNDHAQAHPAGRGRPARPRTHPVALERSQLANEVIVVRDGAEALDYLLRARRTRRARRGQPGRDPARPEAAQGRRPGGAAGRSARPPRCAACRW